MKLIRSVAAGVCIVSLIMAGVDPKSLSFHLIVAGIAAGITFVAHLAQELETK